MTRERELLPDHRPAVVSFGSVEDLLADLSRQPPEEKLVRLERQIRRRSGRDGLGEVMVSAVLAARRKDELLLAQYVVGYLATVHGRPLAPAGEVRALSENTTNALAILEDEVRQAGFQVARGAYALPEGLTIYRATCERIGFSNGRVVDLKGQIARQEVKEDVGQGGRASGQPRQG